MSQQFRRIVLVTGPHGAPLDEVVRMLLHHDYLVTWPGQDLDVVCYDANGVYLYERHLENIELLRLNEETLAHAGIRWDEADGRLPDAVLSPEPLLNMFPPNKSVVLADPRLCLTLPAFNGLVTDVIYVGLSNPAQTAAELVEQWGWDEEHWLRQLKLYDEAFRSHRVKALELSDAECFPAELSRRLASLL